jgi:N-acetyl-gamma-glutamyl-phosphate reductase
MNNNAQISVAVLGATGYVGRELMMLLAGHPRARVEVATSESEAGHGAPHSAVKMVRSKDADLAARDVVFSCLPHGESAAWVERAQRAGARAIDLSADLRVPDEATPQWARGAVYGLPELNRAAIREATLVSNPGCYPTAALLALAPLLRRGLVAGPVVINGASGVTGAGRTPNRELLFAEVAEDFRAYATGNTHRHLAEMRHQAMLLTGASASAPELIFASHLLPVRRGILETIHVQLAESLDDVWASWLEDYGGEPLVDVTKGRIPSLADVVGTNRVAIGVSAVADVSRPTIQIVAAIDNLRKGAAAQAVQNLNLMLGWPELEGLA